MWFPASALMGLFRCASVIVNADHLLFSGDPPLSASRRIIWMHMPSPPGPAPCSFPSLFVRELLLCAVPRPASNLVPSACLWAVSPILAFYRASVTFLVRLSGARHVLHGGRAPPPPLSLAEHWGFSPWPAPSRICALKWLQIFGSIAYLRRRPTTFSACLLFGVFFFFFLLSVLASSNAPPRCAAFIAEFVKDDFSRVVSTSFPSLEFIFLSEVPGRFYRGPHSPLPVPQKLTLSRFLSLPLNVPSRVFCPIWLFLGCLPLRQSFSVGGLPR